MSSSDGSWGSGGHSGQTLDDLMRRAARKHGHRTAVTCEHGQVTYAQLDGRVDRVARTLLDHGLQPGGRVALMMRNGPAFVEAFFGILRAGGIVVAVNFRLGGAEVRHIIDDSGAIAMVIEPEFQGLAAEASSSASTGPVVIVVEHDGRLVTAHDVVVAPGGTGVSLSGTDQPGEWDPACILYTSGTTGRPKGAVLTHCGLCVQAAERASVHQLAPVAEVWFTGVQLFHVTGITTLLASIYVGAELLVLSRGGASALDIADLLESHSVTTCSLVPAQAKALVELPGVRTREFALERLSWGSGPADPATLDGLGKVFGDLHVMAAYGQTECGGHALVLTGDDARRRVGAVGRPLPSTEVRVVDEAMNDVPPGTVGEVVLRSPSVMTQYWRNEAATAEAFAGGWLHTGDLGRADHDGVHWIVGRKKDLIISGGENIYPAEVEAVIAQHPKVADVAVVGVPHDRWGETPVAFVVPVDESGPPTYEEIRDHTLEHLASYKKPTALVTLLELPRNGMGKVQKFRLTQNEETPSHA